MALLQNVKVNWAEVHQENKKYGGWSCEVEVTPEIEALLTRLGVASRIKRTKADYSQEPDADGNRPRIACDPYLKLRIYPVTKAGKRNSPPTVLDGLKRPFKELIGNGSVCNVSIHVYDKADGTKGISWRGIQVIEHVPYGDVTDDFDIVATEAMEDDEYDIVDDEVPFTQEEEVDYNNMYAPSSQ